MIDRSSDGNPRYFTASDEFCPTSLGKVSSITEKLVTHAERVPNKKTKEIFFRALRYGKGFCNLMFSIVVNFQGNCLAWWQRQIRPWVLGHDPAFAQRRDFGGGDTQG